MEVDNRIKRWVTYGLLIGGAFLVYKIVKKQIQKRKVLRSFGSLETITNNQKGNKGGFTLPKNVEQTGFNARIHAQKLQDSMKGLGTTESLIWTTLEPLTPEQREKVRIYFNTYFGDGYSLMEWFEGDLGDKDLQRARDYFN